MYLAFDDFEILHAAFLWFITTLLIVSILYTFKCVCCLRWRINVFINQFVAVVSYCPVKNVVILYHNSSDSPVLQHT